MNIVMPIPSTEFDPSETAIPWKVLTDAGHTVAFATPDGKPGVADDRMVTGRGLLFWSPILRAHRNARDAYAEMEKSDAFLNPMTWGALADVEADGLILPGGHAQGMKPYLNSPEVHALTLRFFKANKPVGAICHGVVVAARTIDPETEKSVLHGRKTTSLTEPLEMSGYAMTALWLGNYFRTYDQTVEDEVIKACGGSEFYDRGPFAVLRDSPEKLERGFIVQDDNYLSARWPGDAYRFANAFLEML